MVKKGQYKNEKHPRWKGNEASYTAKHQWVSRHYGKPEICSNCGTEESKKYDWANLSGEYKRDLNDWVRLCRGCHIKLDGNNNLKEINKRQFYNRWSNNWERIPQWLA